MSCVILRRVDPDGDDISGLLALILLAFGPMQGVVDPESSAFRLTPDSLRAKARAEHAFAVFGPDGPVACMFCDDRGDVLYVGKLAVHPDHQGSGLGRMLLRHAEELAGELGRDMLELQTRVELTANHAFFASRGFVKTGEGAHAGYRRPTWIVMRKSLAERRHG